MAKTIITIQSKDSRDIDLFFTLLGDRVGKGKKQFENDGTHTCMFTIDYRQLQKVVTNGNKNVTKKQDLSVNKSLIARVGLYRNKGLSYQKIADKLNNEGFRTSRRNKLNRMQVMRLYKQYQDEGKKLLKKK